MAWLGSVETCKRGGGQWREHSGKWGKQFESGGNSWGGFGSACPSSVGKWGNNLKVRERMGGGVGNSSPPQWGLGETSLKWEEQLGRIWQLLPQLSGKAGKQLESKGNSWGRCWQLLPQLSGK